MMHRELRALTRVEIIVILTVTAVAIGIASILIGNARTGARQASARLMDATQLCEIHKSWLTFANEFNGILPTPGLVKRLPDPVLGATTGRGPEDISQNTTANLYSMCIMNNYLKPDLCVGPSEPSPHVKPRGPDTYDWAALNIQGNVFWDTGFRADLHGVSNVSYAHQPICGERQLKHWRSTTDVGSAVIGNRGPLNGAADAKSITNRIHQPFDRWSGNIVFADNHVEFLQTFCAKGSNDNVFAWDQGTCLDVLLTFTKAMGESGPTIEHD